VLDLRPAHPNGTTGLKHQRRGGSRPLTLPSATTDRASPAAAGAPDAGTRHSAQCTTKGLVRIFRTVIKKLSPELSRLTYNKLVLINAAESINDLRVPPGNRLEKLAGSRVGQYSVRVNDQWRICFTWSTAGAGNVELVDYH
jgi:proteic killer suppression protein